jgi:hypothetical protein
MAEPEVESILREIRERVVTHELAATTTPAANGDNQWGAPRDLPAGNRVATENLALVNSYLTTTARAWDRLPPVVSNRSGFRAQLELWCKRLMKRATRWYAWEQINFNAAVHHALRDLLPVLAAYEQELARLRAEHTAAAEAHRSASEQYQNQLDTLRAELAARRAEIGALLQRQNDLTSVQTSQVEAQLQSLTNELRERDTLLRAEQRVCFKQLALETGEAATLADRARRKTETLLAELQRRLDQLEQAGKGR